MAFFQIEYLSKNIIKSGYIFHPCIFKVILNILKEKLNIVLESNKKISLT